MASPTPIALFLLLTFCLPGPARPPSAASEAIARGERLWMAADLDPAASAFREGLRALRERPGDRPAHWVAEAAVLIRRLGQWSDLLGDAPDSAPEFLAWTSSEAGAPPLLAALARFEAGRALLASTGDPDRAREVWAPLGFLKAWRIAGPFDNERGGGFSRPLGPEKSLDLEARYDGKKRKVGWRRLPRRPLAGELDLDALLRPADECLAYAITFVESERDVAAALRVGSGEGYRAWINGDMIAEEDLHRRRGFDQSAARARLRAGWNVVVLEVAEATGPWGFRARLSRPDGSALEGVAEGEPPAEAIGKLAELWPLGRRRIGAKDETAEPVPAGCHEIPGARLKSGGSDAREAFLLGSLLQLRAAHDAATHPDTASFQRAVEIDPSPAIFHYELARSHHRPDTSAAERDENAMRRSLLAAAARGSAWAAFRLASHYASTFENRTLASRWARRALELSPHAVDARLFLGDLDTALGVVGASDRALEEALRVAPRAKRFLLREAARLAKRGRASERREILAGLLGRDQLDASVRKTLTESLLVAGEVEAAVRMIGADRVLHPFSVQADRQLATIALGRARPLDAARALARALEIRPEDHDLVRQRGDALLEGGDREGALAAWDRSIELQPNQPSLRERIELLRSTHRFEDEFRIDLAERIAAALGRGPQAGGDPARVLLDARAIEVNPDGTTREFVQYAARILNDRGVRMFGSYSVSYAPGEQVVEFQKGRVTRPGGRFADAKLSRHAGARSARGTWQRASLDLPPVSVGDVVEVEYVREDIRQSFFGDYFGHIELFRSTLPTDEKLFALRVPAGREFYFHAVDLDAEPEVSEDAESATVTRRWRRLSIPRIDPEPAMPPLSEVCPRLEVSTFPDWEAFSSWYSHLIRKQFESSPALEREVRELTSGARTDLERARAIYEFVVTDVRYNAWEFGVHGFQPYDAATVFARRFGDCKDKSTLLKAMLAQVDIPCEPVLIRASTSRGREDLTLPVVNHFNHCIAHVPAGDGRPELWLDGTATFHALEDLPSMDRGARVLLVRPEGAEIATVPWNTPDQLSLQEEWAVALREDGGATARVRIRARGDFAVEIRRSFEIAAQRQERIEKLYGGRYAGAKVSSLSFSDLSNLREPVAISFSLEIPRLATPSPEGSSIPFPDDFFGTAEGLGGIGALESRQFDLILGNPRRARLRLDIDLPRGLDLRAAPRARRVSTPWGALGITVTPGAERRITIERDLEITAQRVPRAEYPRFRELSASVGRLGREKIILRRSGAPPPEPPAPPAPEPPVSAAPGARSEAR